MARKFGEDAVGQPCFQVLYQRESPCSFCHQERIQRGERVRGEDLRSIDGRFYHVSHNPIRHADGRISKMTIFRDVSDLKAAEEAHLESERQYRKLVETMREGICVIDTEDRFSFVNQRFCSMLGYCAEEIVGRPFDEFLDPVNLRKMNRERNRRRRDGTDPYELRWVKKDGGPVVTSVSPSVLLDSQSRFRGSFAVVTDITEQKRSENEKSHLEVQLRQAQKMEAIGVLAGGIAHDFNNILMPIMGFTELIRDVLPDDHQALDYVQPILDASQRAKELVFQILSFSRQSNEEMRPTLIAPLVSEPLKLLKASIPANIEIDVQIHAKDAMILANPVHVHQVVMNLCTNAYHAMEKTGGRLSVRLTTVDLSPSTGPRQLLDPTPHACLTVSDTGPGIEPEFLTRIFDPYFTTKEQGKGTGLGLSVVHGIVSSCQGDIHVDSRLGAGTTFQVFFPLMVSTAAGESADPKKELQGGTETVLLVDDEPPIVQLQQRILERLGYTVITRQSSLDALETFNRDPDAIDLVMTDLAMPHLTGLEMAEKIIAIRPDIPILMLTGFSERLTESSLRNAGIRRVIMKPALSKDLAAAIRDVLVAAAEPSKRVAAGN